MIYTPLEQFTVFPVVGLELGGLNISITNSALTLLLVASALIALFYFPIVKSTLTPSKWQSVAEMLYEFVQNIMKENMAEFKKEQKFFPLIFVLFTLILFSNLLGLVPYSFTVTGHIIITFTLAFSVWFGATILGFVNHGIRFFALFLPDGVPLAIVPFIVSIEFLSYFSKPFSLALRLFANMMAGHILFAILAGFSFTMFLSGTVAMSLLAIMPLALIVVLTGLEVGICCIQAYVFAVLSSMYLNDGLQGSH